MISYCIRLSPISPVSPLAKQQPHHLWSCPYLDPPFASGHHRRPCCTRVGLADRWQALLHHRVGRITTGNKDTNKISVHIAMVVTPHSPPKWAFGLWNHLWPNTMAVDEPVDDDQWNTGPSAAFSEVGLAASLAGHWPSLTYQFNRGSVSSVSLNRAAGP